MRYAKLQKTSGSANNNKYYEMQQTSDGTFEVRYGRVGSRPQVRSYNMSQWQKKHGEKIRKGYVDVTETQALVTTQFTPTGDASVDELLTELQRYSNDSFTDSYSGPASGVTQAQVTQAQDVLNALSKIYSSGRLDEKSHVSINESLETLYTILPRNMKNVRDYLVSDLTNERNYEFFGNLLVNEQDTLDNASIVSTMAVDKKETTLPKSLEVELSIVEDGVEIDAIRKMMQDSSGLFSYAYHIVKPEHQALFDNGVRSATNKLCKTLWHGTRTQNVLSIMKKSLLVRPSNAAHTGSMFGDGLYFSDYFGKSLNYTSLRGSLHSGGADSHGFLFVFNVHLGHQLVIESRTSRHGSLNYDKIVNDGFDSVFAPQGGRYTGSRGTGTLINNEMIVYRSEQATMKYVVKVNNH